MAASMVALGAAGVEPWSSLFGFGGGNGWGDDDDGCGCAVGLLVAVIGLAFLIVILAAMFS